jgi:hypothetical protein
MSRLGVFARACEIVSFLLSLAFLHAFFFQASALLAADARHQFTFLGNLAGQHNALEV